jgi:hypothetical protein
MLSTGWSLVKINSVELMIHKFVAKVIRCRPTDANFYETGQVQLWNRLNYPYYATMFYYRKQGQEKRSNLAQFIMKNMAKYI